MELEDDSWKFMQAAYGGLFVRVGSKFDGKVEVIRDKIKEALSQEPGLVLVRGSIFDGVYRPVGIYPTDGINHVLFNPIIATLHLPGRLQPIGLHGATYSKENLPEDYVIVYDGQVLFMVACPARPTHTHGFPDVRDKVTELLAKVVSVEEIAPNISPFGIIVLNGPNQISGERSTDQYFTTFPLPTKVTKKQGIEEVYHYFDYYLDFLYSILDVSREADVVRRRLQAEEKKLFDLFKTFNRLNFINFPERRKVGKDIRVAMTSILELLSKHNSIVDSVGKWEANLTFRIQEQNYVREVLEKNRWNSLIQPDKIDREFTLVLIEHARDEMEAYGGTSITVWAAIVGAAVAFLLSLLAVLLHL